MMTASGIGAPASTRAQSASADIRPSATKGTSGGIRDLEHAGGRSVASVLAGVGVLAEIW